MGKETKESRKSEESVVKAAGAGPKLPGPIRPEAVDVGEGIKGLLLLSNTIPQSDTSITPSDTSKQFKTPDKLIENVRNNEPLYIDKSGIKSTKTREKYYRPLFNAWFKKTFKTIPIPTGGDALTAYGDAYAAYNNIYYAYIVRNYAKRHEITSNWNAGMALNNAIKDNYDTLIKFAAQKAYNESAWGAVMNQFSSFVQESYQSAASTTNFVLSKFGEWAKTNIDVARYFFETNLGNLIIVAVSNFAIGAGALGTVYYFPGTLYNIIYYLATLGVQLGIYGSIGAAIVAIGALIKESYNISTRKLGGIHIVDNSVYILKAINDPTGDEATQLLAAISTYTSPTLGYLNAMWEDMKKQVERENMSDAAQFEELLKRSKKEMQEKIASEKERESKIAVSDVWWDAYRSVLLGTGNTVTAKTAADTAVKDLETTLIAGGAGGGKEGGKDGGKEGGGGATEGGGYSGRNTKRKRHSKKTKAKTHHKKSHKKRRTKSKKHRK